MSSFPPALLLNWVVRPQKRMREVLRELSEADWLSCQDDPLSMLHAVSDESHDQRMGEFVCRCWRQLWHLLPDECREIIQQAEQYLERYPPSGVRELYLQNELYRVFPLVDGRVWLEDGTGSIAPAECWDSDAGKLAAMTLVRKALDYWDWGSVWEEEEYLQQHADRVGGEGKAGWERMRSFQCDQLRRLFSLQEALRGQRRGAVSE